MPNIENIIAQKLPSFQELKTFLWLRAGVVSKNRNANTPAAKRKNPQPFWRLGILFLCKQKQSQAFPAKSVYLIDYFDPNRGRYGVALSILYLQPDFV